MDKVAIRTGQPILKIHPQEVRARVRPKAPQMSSVQMPQDSARVYYPKRAPIPAAYVQMDLSNLVQYSAPADNTRVENHGKYTQKMLDSMKEFADADHKQAQGYGKFFSGAATATLAAPAGAMEAAGRTAIAMTGGEVVYRGKSPLDHMGDGVGQMGQGTVDVLDATGDKVAALGKTVMYAPLAGVEAAAYGAGMAAYGAGVMAGATVRVVSESYFGEKFKDGYQAGRH